jgi:hypothetical protein
MPPQFVVNDGETAVRIDPTRQSTRSEKGSECVRPRLSGSSKECFLVAAMSSGDGTKHQLRFVGVGG